MSISTNCDVLGINTKTDFGMKPESVSEWEEGILIINSILLPGSPAYEALSSVQRDGLYKVQQTLLDGGKQESKHVPIELNNEIPSLYEKFILCEYAGINKTELSAKKKFTKVVNVHRFVHRLSTTVSVKGNRKFEKFYVPPEWTVLTHDIKIKLAEILSWESLSKWSFNIFEVNKLTNGNVLLFLGWAIMASPYAQYAMQTSLLEEGTPAPSLDGMKGYRFIETFKISQKKFCRFLGSIEKDYNNENAYHNSIHGADVVQSVHSIFTMMNHESISDISDLEEFSILLAAVIHDVKHPGRNNTFQINNKTKMAMMYNDTSVLENMHVSTAFSRIMGEDKDDNIDILKGMQPAQTALCRKICIDAVLHTDMTKHFSYLDQVKGIWHKHNQGSATQMNGSDILSFVLHMADISNASKPLETAMKWADLCLEEFFAQGDEEESKGLTVSPLCSRSETNKAESQVGFIKYVIQPSYKVLGKFISKVDKEVNPIIESNLLFWENEMKKNNPEN